jgi:hypothetical protein
MFWAASPATFDHLTHQGKLARYVKHIMYNQEDTKPSLLESCRRTRCAEKIMKTFDWQSCFKDHPVFWDLVEDELTKLLDDELTREIIC